MTEYKRTHPEYAKKCLDKLGTLHKKQVCTILKKHSDDLKEDPEHLSTEFIQKLIKYPKK